MKVIVIPAKDLKPRQWIYQEGQVTHVRFQNDRVHVKLNNGTPNDGRIYDKDRLLKVWGEG